ncbi:glycine cleavage system protein H [candidate division WOR-1 bacterium RIFCSPHIGHO2_01_FULL_53_15]|uniref:Glycine cleavage system H protein n=1 Tax=candidate division WOR-1 bacterium RIFCSPHIGHO2_01_FULL_53_15 TaxID=1802564 RepID=A0A1F4Q153_UNCSA|nr:MAG: glycine cleavage system protein H [candidate division WOR-1 bacterium RIFCSPHIGHO2_01_FULL_53_15]OGC10630.1 MAG: glycine cleavage system protein H [candidate division WOR-1 bacterium RIFCSPHIGHO2_02_FULL_53_26]
MSYPAELKYSKEHEWIRVDGKVATIGITFHAQDALGDVVYVEMPSLGKELAARQEFGVVESVKSVSSLFCPVSGKVIERNAELEKRPELINSSPYESGWIIKVEMSDPAELNKLLSAADYQKTLPPAHKH